MGAWRAALDENIAVLCLQDSGRLLGTDSCFYAITFLHLSFIVFLSSLLTRIHSVARKIGRHHLCAKEEERLDRPYAKGEDKGDKKVGT